MFSGVKSKNKDGPDETVQLLFLSCTLKTQDCLLNLICNSTLHIPLNITRQQRAMWSGFLGIKVRKTVHSFCPDGTGRVNYSVPQSDCCYLILVEVGIFVLSGFRWFLKITGGIDIKRGRPTIVTWTLLTLHASITHKCFLKSTIKLKFNKGHQEQETLTWVNYCCSTGLWPWIMESKKQRGQRGPSSCAPIQSLDIKIKTFLSII